jgi:protein-S-isoprenylcysteine O-methyltransferase Ste14
MPHDPSHRDAGSPDFWRSRYAIGLTVLGFLLQSPTLLTLAMFPILVAMYARLAANEEAEMQSRFGAAWERDAAATPRFIPQRRSAAAA